VPQACQLAVQAQASLASIADIRDLVLFLVSIRYLSNITGPTLLHAQSPAFAFSTPSIPLASPGIARTPRYHLLLSPSPQLSTSSGSYKPHHNGAFLPLSSDGKMPFWVSWIASAFGLERVTGLIYDRDLCQSTAQYVRESDSTGVELTGALDELGNAGRPGRASKRQGAHNECIPSSID
jgi:hypothetical protein